MYAITIVKFSNRSIQNLFNVDRGACMDSRKLYGGKGTSQFPVEFVNFNPLSYCLGEIIGFDEKTSFASRPVSHLIRWYNKPGDITKEFWEKAIQFRGTFHGLKITNCSFSLSENCRDVRETPVSRKYVSNTCGKRWVWFGQFRRTFDQILQR